MHCARQHYLEGGLHLDNAPFTCFWSQIFIMIAPAYCSRCVPVLLESSLCDCLQSVDISLNCPWILQQYLTGREYSCYTVADEGRIVAHSDNIASLSCLNFGHVDSREIAEWMETFCSKLKLTGQVGSWIGSICLRTQAVLLPHCSR